MNLKDLLTFLLIMVIFYFIGSFIVLSFNPNDWTFFGRYIYSFLGIPFAILGTAGLKSLNKNK